MVGMDVESSVASDTAAIVIVLGSWAGIELLVKVLLDYSVERLNASRFPDVGLRRCTIRRPELIGADFQIWIAIAAAVIARQLSRAANIRIREMPAGQLL